MQAILFFLAVMSAVVILALYLKKSSASTRAELARKKREENRVRNIYADKLATPGNNLLANNDEVWRARRQHVGLAAESPSRTMGKQHLFFEPDSDPEYDGYSRADRHHLTPARVKKEGRLDDLETPRFRIKPRQSDSDTKGR